MPARQLVVVDTGNFRLRVERSPFSAALLEKMLEAAAEHSDGVILNLFPRDALPKMMDHIRIGAERLEKLEDVEVVCRHQVIVTDDVEDVSSIRGASAPFTMRPFVYNAFWHGLVMKTWLKRFARAGLQRIARKPPER